MNFIVYDFDGTIYNGDSSKDFLKFLIKKKKKLIFHLPKMLVYFIKYKLKLITKEKMKECFFEIFKNFKNIDDLINEFWGKHENNLKSFFINKKSHKNDIISSASPYFLLEPIKNKYKVFDLFGSPVNKTSGKYNGKNCHGEEKVKLLHEKYPNSVVLEMYSDDAIADKPLLELAKKSYIVKKEKIIEYQKYNKKKEKNIIKAYNKHEEIYNYLIVGFLTTLVSLISYTVLVKTILDSQNSIQLQIANIASWIISVTFAYFSNRIVVFKSKEKNILKEATNFYASRIFTLLLDMLTMFIIVTVCNLNDLIGKIISQLLVIIGNYIISKIYVFKKKD